MLVKVPAFDAQLTLIDRMGFHRQGAVDFTVNNFKKNSAAGSAVRADRGDEFAIHILLLLKDFYKQNNFKYGDSIIIKYRNYKKCEFNIEYYSIDKHQENFFFANKINENFIHSLKNVLKLKLPYPNIEKQLLYSFYYIKDQDFTTPVTSLGPLLNENREILIGIVNSGIKVLFLKGQNLNNFQSTTGLESK